MKALPIVARELRVAARARGTYVSRVTAAGAAVATGGAQVWVQTDLSSGAVLGSILFSTLGGLALVLVCLAGPAWTAGTLCRERREGTLGLLFLTDLGPWDIVWGKLAATSLTAVGGLLALLPMLAVSLLLGGVSPAELGRAALVLGNTLWLSLALGLAVSSRCEQERSAVALTFFLLFLLTVVLPWLAGVFRAAGAPGFVGGEALSPLGAWRRVPALAYPAEANAFWLGQALAHGLGWLALYVAARGCARAWREGAPGHRERWQARLLRAVLGGPEKLRRRRTALLERHPLLWGGPGEEGRRLALGAGVGALLGAWLLAWALTSGRWWTPGITLVSAWLLQAGLKWLVAAEAAGRLAEARRSGVLELWLTSGLGEGEVVRGLRRAVRRLFLPSVVALAGVETWMLVADAGAARGWGSRLFGLAAMGLFVWDLEVLATVALWYAASAQSPQRAALRTLGRVLVVPWVIFLAVLFGVGVWNWTVVAGLWLAIGALNNHRVGRAARHALDRQFRAALAGA